MTTQRNNTHFQDLLKPAESSDKKLDTKHIKKDKISPNNQEETFQTENPNIMEQIHAAKELGQG